MEDPAFLHRGFFSVPVVGIPAGVALPFCALNNCQFRHELATRRCQEDLLASVEHVRSLGEFDV
jgi:hypothetical protein